MVTVLLKWSDFFHLIVLAKGSMLTKQTSVYSGNCR